MQVSFVIPLFNCLPITQAMLASLQATIPPDLAHEIIVVDDGSTDGTREWLQRLPADRFRIVLNERNLGYAGANNRGAALARGNFLALLNNDLVLTPHWLEPMLATHAKLAPRAGLIGNVQLDARTGAIDHTGIVVNVTGKPVHARTRPSFGARRGRSYWIVPAVTGACVLLQRALWQELGGFNDAYVNGGEDIDLCFRARAIGRINAVALSSIVRHHVSASPGRKLRDEENSYRLARRWRPELIAAADDGTRAWCREYLAGALVNPRARDYALTLGACAYLGRVRHTPPWQAVAAVREGLAREFERWEQMFGSVPPASDAHPQAAASTRGP